MRVEQDWFVRRDGSMVPVGLLLRPARDRRGPLGAVVVFRDISERLESEAAHARAIAEEARAEEIAASRARLVSAAAEERRRIGRDLHDGAQQRLVQALMRIEEARRATPSPALDAAVGGDPPRGPRPARPRRRGSIPPCSPTTGSRPRWKT